jgi:hypothetical protein
MNTLPVEIKYKIMSNLPPEKLKGLTNEAMFRVYCDRWGKTKWDGSLDWHLEFAKKFNRHFAACCDAFEVEFPWDEHVDWLSMSNLIPKPLPDDPDKDDYFDKYKPNTWIKIFNGDKRLYRQLIDDLAEPLQTIGTEYDSSLRIYMLQHAIAVLLWQWGDQPRYLRTFLRMIFKGDRYIEEFRGELVWLISSGILSRCKASTVIEWFLADQTDYKLVCVKDMRYWLNENEDLMIKATGLAYIIPYFKRDIPAYDFTMVYPEDVRSVDKRGSRANALRQFYGALLGKHETLPPIQEAADDAEDVDVDEDN